MLRGVTMSVGHPSITVVLGPNGSGKTTLLRVLLGMVRPSSGEVRVLGLDPAEEAEEVRRRCAYVPQKEYISAEVPLSVFEVVLMGRYAKKRPPRRVGPEDRRAVMEALEAVGLSDLAKRPFRELSGGQQQRVLVARALASEPELMLLDEPMSGADAESRERIADVLVEMREEGVSSVVVTHDVNPLAEAADYVAVLSGGELALFGRPAEVLTEDALSSVYGRAKVFRVGEVCYALISDWHG